MTYLGLGLGEHARITSGSPTFARDRTGTRHPPVGRPPLARGPFKMTLPERNRAMILNLGKFFPLTQDTKIRDTIRLKSEPDLSKVKEDIWINPFQSPGGGGFGSIVNVSGVLTGNFRSYVQLGKPSSWG